MTTLNMTMDRAIRRSGTTVAFLIGIAATGCADGSNSQFGPPENVADSKEAATPATKKFGSWCQSGHYDIYPPDGGPWLTDTGTTMCARFNTEMAKTATKEFDFSLKGAAKENWEAAFDSNSMEKVDLSFAYIHGGAHVGGTAEYGLWKDGLTFPEAKVYTSNMRLGEETTSQRGLSILATYACDVLQADANMWTRWANAFRGGLRIVLASHSDVQTGSNTNDIGKVFAQKLGAGVTLAEAWRYALASTDNATPVAVMATGATAADCGARRDGMTFGNFTSSGRLKDNDIKFFCWTTWDNQ